MGAKISGEAIAEFEDIRIYARLSKAKRKGKDRLWIHIRQGESKRWKVAATLSYERSLDIRFEGDAGESTELESGEDRDSENETVLELVPEEV